MATLWRATPWGYYWRLGDHTTQWTETMPIEDCALGMNNVYFGVHGARDERGPKARTILPNVAALNCLFAEFDGKDFGGTKDNPDAGMGPIRDKIKTLTPQPSVIVYSGGGYHCYWLTGEPLPIAPQTGEDDYDPLDYPKGLQRAWARYVGGDNGARDLARILRLPGTTNMKYGAPRPVQFVRFDIDRRYDWADLAAIAEGDWEDEKVRHEAVQTVESADMPVEVRTMGTKGVLTWFGAAAEGQRNNRLFWAANRLFDIGMTNASVTAELSPIARQIGLPDHEITSSIKSAEKEERRAPKTFTVAMSTSVNSKLRALRSKYQ